MPLAFQTMGVPALAIEALYAATLCHGLFSDYKRFIIPNAVSLTVAGLFFLHHWLVAPQDPLAPHLIAGAGAFALFLAPYFLGQMAAGDVKLIRRPYALGRSARWASDVANHDCYRRRVGRFADHRPKVDIELADRFRLSPSAR